MQSEISFLLELILDEELSPTVMKKCRKRLKDVEANLSTQPTIKSQSAQKLIHGATQAPSTQKLLDEMATQTGAPITPIPVIPVAARIVGGEINTGGGTRGPRKF